MDREAVDRRNQERPSPNRRLAPHAVTPAHEDRGLFRNPVGRFTVELVPLISRNAREDIVIRGFLVGRVAVEVVVAGRRTAHADPLLKWLRGRRVRAEKAARAADAPFDVDSVRCAIAVEGAWRPRFVCDESGWQTRRFQLLAARWSLPDGGGQWITFGEPAIT